MKISGKFPCIVMLYMLAKEFCFANWLSLFPSFLESVFVILNIAFLITLFIVNKVSSFVFSFHFPFHSSHLEKKFLTQTLSRYFFIYLLPYAAVTKEYLFFTMKSIFSKIEYFEIRFYSLNNAIQNGIQNRSNTATIDNTNTTIIFNF